LPFFSPTPLHLSNSSFLDLKVSSLFNLNGSCNLSLLISLFTFASVKEILKIPISLHLDTPFLWTPSSNGLFSTSSVYRLISSPRINSISSPFESSIWKSLWKLKLNARLLLFLWKIAWNLLPTKTRLKALFHIPALDSLCPLCSSEEESLSHLFFNCIFARVAWRSSFWPLDSSAWSSFSPSHWIEGILAPHSVLGIPLADCHLFQIYASVLCDQIWYARNKAVHEGSIQDISTLASSIRKSALDHAATWKSSSPLVNEY
jgi:hypothetical protein